jgi:16S rRNA (cytosine967-C5)-methyltransferase
MRGVEAALEVLRRADAGGFASEALRKIERIEPTERKLAATLAYATLRRRALWRRIAKEGCRRSFDDLPPTTRDALLLGTAGLLEIRNFAPAALINALIERLRAAKRSEDVPLLNGILRWVSERGPRMLETFRTSAALADQALFRGVPGWAATEWARAFGVAEAKRLCTLMGMKTYTALRLSPGVDPSERIRLLREAGCVAWPSPFFPGLLRTASTALPRDLPGYPEGAFAPTTESAQFVVEAATAFHAGSAILDCCAGRGVKAAALAAALPGVRIEAWDVSEDRVRAGGGEMRRLGGADRGRYRQGGALALVPEERPGLILLDVPCTGSGTWRRHPEAKWRTRASDLAERADLQRRLLERARELVAPGGAILYSTCSLFRQENEEPVAAVIGAHPDLVEVPIPTRRSFVRPGKPYGRYVRPELPWLDGFYAAALVRRS